MSETVLIGKCTWALGGSADEDASRTWFNEIGNREQYMNCAVVSIDGTGTRYGL